MSKESDLLKAEPSLLSKIDAKDLKSIKVALTRKSVPTGPEPAVFLRSLVEPESLRVNLSGVEGRPIFYRDDVRVNVHAVTKAQFFSSRETSKGEPENTGEPKPGTSRQSQNKRSLFGGYINSPLPFTEHSKNDGSYRRGGRAKSPRRSRSRSSSQSPFRKSRRSRSSSTEQRYREKEYRKRSHNSSPAGRVDYRRRKSSRSRSKSPDRRRRYSRSPDHHNRSYKRRSRSVSPRRTPPYKQKEYHRSMKSPDRRRRTSREPSPRSKYPSKVYRPAERCSSQERRVTHYLPLRPGEYRPPKHRSPPLRPGEYKPPEHDDYIGMHPPVEQFFPARMMPPVMFPYQYVPAIPIRPMFPPMHRPMRPRIIYNNRPYPKLELNKEGASNGKSGDEKSDAQKKKNSSDESK